MNIAGLRLSGDVGGCVLTLAPQHNGASAYIICAFQCIRDASETHDFPSHANHPLI